MDTDVKFREDSSGTRERKKASPGFSSFQISQFKCAYLTVTALLLLLAIQPIHCTKRNLCWGELENPVFACAKDEGNLEIENVLAGFMLKPAPDAEPVSDDCNSPPAYTTNITQLQVQLQTFCDAQYLAPHICQLSSNYVDGLFLNENYKPPVTFHPFPNRIVVTYACTNRTWNGATSMMHFTSRNFYLATISSILFILITFFAN